MLLKLPFLKRKLRLNLMPMLLLLFLLNLSKMPKNKNDVFASAQADAEPSALSSRKIVFSMLQLDAFIQDPKLLELTRNALIDNPSMTSIEAIRFGAAMKRQLELFDK